MRALAAWQVSVHLRQALERQTRYRHALEYARAIGKPLLVVGGPYGGPMGLKSHWAAHPAGDVCLDLNPEACQGAPQVIVADIRDMWMIPDKHFGALFNSHILEHLPSAADAQRAWAEMHRVADKVFTCVPSKMSIPSWLWPDHRLWVEVDGDVLFLEEMAWKRGGG